MDRVNERNERNRDFSQLRARVPVSAWQYARQLVFLLRGVTSRLQRVKGVAFEDYPCLVAE